LGELRAAESLALVLEALGDAEGAQALRSSAHQHFENFTAHLAEADRHVENVDARADLLTPGGFLATDAGLIAWHPLGLVFIQSFQSYASTEFDQAKLELRQAGEENRLRDLDQQSAGLDSDVARGRLLSLVVTGAYAAVLVIGAVRLSSAWLRQRGDRRLVERGNVVLGTVRAADLDP
jgi:hypothetical protein